MKPWLLLLLFSLPLQAARAGNIPWTDWFTVMYATQKIEIKMVTDTSHTEPGWYTVIMRWNIGSPDAYFKQHGCSTASLNDVIAQANEAGWTNSYVLANIKTPNGKRWTWYSDTPPTDIDARCTQ